MLKSESVTKEAVPNWETPVPSLREDLTPNHAFFVRTHFPIPTISRSTWRLEIDGEVDSPREFTYSELSKMKQETVSCTIECAGNGRTGFKTIAPGELPWGLGAIGTATWTGVPLSEILRKVGVTSTARELVAEGADSGLEPGSKWKITYERGLPLEKAQAKGTLLALRMNGKTLTAEHGYPVRLIVPGWYGMASVKWVIRLTLRSGEPFRGFFNAAKYVYVKRNWGSIAREPVTEMKVKSLVTTPTEGDALKAGYRVDISGKAWSGSGRIVRVEVNSGEGWEDAQIVRRAGRFAWVVWKKKWRPTKKGTRKILARSTDDAGNTQPIEPLENEFQYGNNAVNPVRVRVV